MILNKEVKLSFLEQMREVVAHKLLSSPKLLQVYQFNLSNEENNIFAGGSFKNNLCKNNTKPIAGVG